MKWINPVQLVPKTTRIIVIMNEKNDLVFTRVYSRGDVDVDYRKLNMVTRKGHLSFPFIDQILERLAGHTYYCFLDEYSDYTQLSIKWDEDKTTFTCPLDTFASRRMPFGLCNAHATFQYCMIFIFF